MQSAVVFGHTLVLIQMSKTFNQSTICESIYL